MIISLIIIEMKTYTKQFIIIILLISSHITQAQPVNIGFKVEPSFIFTEGIGGNNTDGTFWSGYLLLGYTLNDKLQIEFQPGFIFGLEKYNSSNIGMVGKYSITEKSYLTAGVWLNKQRNENTHLYRSYDFDMILGSIGYGLLFEKIMFIQLSYQFPIGNNEIGHTIIQDSYDPRNNSIVKKRINGIFKFGIGFSFDL